MAKELRNKHGGDDCCRIVPMNYGLAIILNPTCSGAFVAMEQMLECAAAGHHFDDAEYMTALREEALARWDDMPTSDRMDLATDLFEDDISIVLEDKPEDENLIHYIVDRYDIN
jgi:hypothetical protein